MADISMCPGEGCGIRKWCYRFTAKASNYQSYADFSGQYEDPTTECLDYWPNSPEAVIKINQARAMSSLLDEASK